MLLRSLHHIIYYCVMEYYHTPRPRAAFILFHVRCADGIDDNVCFCGLLGQHSTRGAHRIFFQGVIDGGRGQWLGGTMASAEHEPITVVWGQSPWSGGQRGEAPLKLKAFWSLDVQRSLQI